jgi:lipoprotein-anchoring transpeptidase ErfK/SrfK
MRIEFGSLMPRSLRFAAHSKPLRRTIIMSAVAAAIGAGLVTSPTPAAAQGFFFWSDPPSRPRPSERVRRGDWNRPRPAATRPQLPDARTASAAVPTAKSASAPGSALVAVVSIRNQSITVWDQSGPVLQSRVSTGQAGHSTPTGLFSVIQKNRFHHSNIYSGAPMPWMHRITWSGIALHAGVVPNYPASHGCIRLPYDVAPKLWAMSRVGMRVAVTPSETELRMINNDLLPQPRLMSADEVAGLLRRATGNGIVAGIVPVSDTADRSYNPVEVAGFLRKQAAVTIEASKVAAREALAASAQASAEANAAIAEARAARVALVAAEAEARAQSQTADADSKDQVDRAAAKIAADARLAEARQRYRDAAAAEAEKDPRAFELAAAARAAEKLAEEAPDQLKEAARRLEPLSVFISRKEGQVFVRQGFEQVMDVAVEITEPLMPLGTHVFTAMAPSDDGKRIKWAELTMPDSSGAGSATEALRRITLPAKVKEEIARRVWTGASIVISDHGISHETGRGTDFVVLTK